MRLVFVTKDEMDAISIFLLQCLLSEISLNNYLIMNGGKFSLSFKDFEQNAGIKHRKLIDDTNFTDVTLACDEGKIKAHKVILSSSSPVLEQILVGNSNQHPLIYLRKVKYSCLKSLVQFIYLGQTEIGQTELQDFINLGDELEIDGLNQDQHNETQNISSEENQSNPEMKFEECKENRDKDETKNISEIVEIKPELVPEAVNQKEIAYSTKSQTIEKSGNGYKCDECGKCFTQSGGVYSHKMSAHKGIRHPCEHCQYTATTKSNLKRHIYKHHTDH